MTQGFSGSYAVNGVNLSLQPSEGQWIEKDVLTRDGQGRPIYSALGEFVMSWGLMSTSEFNQLMGFYEYVSNTGTSVVDLPKWADADYKFYSYSGTIINRPTVGVYFNTYVTDVRLVVSSIRVS